MNKIYLLLTLLTMGFVTNAQLPTNGLLAHWKFNGNATDATGNGHNGNSINNITYTQGVTPNDTAALFNGINSYILVPYQNDLNISQYTICAKVKLNGFYTGACQANVIFQRGQEYNSGYYQMQLFDNQTDSSCAITGDTSNFVFTSTIAKRRPYHTAWRDTPTIRTNRWYCVVATFDSLEYNIYIDGVLRITAHPRSFSSNIGTSSAGISIGANRFGNFSQYPYWLNGAVDDLVLYNRPFTQAEVSSYCGITQSPDTTITLASLSDTVLCAESTVTANYSVNYNYGAANIFTLQLSDASGSFASPINAGFTSSTTSGSITGFIPGTLSPGNYKLRVISTNPVKISNTKNITVAQTVSLSASISASPSVNVGPFSPITFTATLPNGITNTSYQWKKNGVTITGATNSTYTATSTVNILNGDKIHVTVNSNQPCTFPSMVNSDTLTIGISLSASELSRENEIRVFPNPNKGKFTISGIVNTKNIRLLIINNIGKIVYSQEIITQDGTLYKTINIDNIPSGIYQMRLQVGNETKLIPIQIK